MDKNNFQLDPYACCHAISSLIIGGIAIACGFLFPSDQQYWLLLSAIFLSQVAFDAHTAKSGLICFCAGGVLGLCVFLMTLVAQYFWIALAFIIFLTLTLQYLGGLKRKLFMSVLVIQFLTILAYFNPGDLTMAVQRLALILVASLVVLTIKYLFYLGLKPYRDRFAWILFLQKLQKLFKLIFYTPETHRFVTSSLEESDFYGAITQGLMAKNELPKKDFCKPVEKIWDLTLSLGSLRHRMVDEATLGMAQEEFKLLFKNMTAVLWELKCWPKTQTLDLKNFSMAIQSLDELFHGAMQSIAKEPLVLFLFIQDLYSFREALENFNEGIAG